MFGLMRAKKCGMSADEKHFRRLNYCGTCKTIGASYGTKARLLLNHDVVFLAEILSSLEDRDVSEWQRPYQSFNCLSLPQGSMPTSLLWAAAANVVLTEFKLADHADDGDGMGHIVARRIFSKEFRKAKQFLSDRNFPFDQIKTLLRSQTERERNAASLEDLAYPTAQTTAVFFHEGAIQIGRADLRDKAFDLGFAFGSLIYLLDAFEDHSKDFRYGKFNAIRAVYKTENGELRAEIRRKVISVLRGFETQIVERINDLPIAENRKIVFTSRLSQNLQRKLGARLPVLHTASSCAVTPRITFAERWNTAVHKASELARNYSWQMPAVFVFVLAFALIAPTAQVREARSARECFDLGFNLMFLGAAFGSVLALPKGLFLENPPPEVVEEAEEEVGKKAAKAGGDSSSESCCYYCDGCCCCDCDCCGSD
jgi:hypothetical protein